MLFLERSVSGKWGQGRSRGGLDHFQTCTSNWSCGTWERAGKHEVFKTSEYCLRVYDWKSFVKYFHNYTVLWPVVKKSSGSYQPELGWGEAGVSGGKLAESCFWRGCRQAARQHFPLAARPMPSPCGKHPIEDTCLLFSQQGAKPRSWLAVIIKDGNFHGTWVLILVKFQPW